MHLNYKYCLFIIIIFKKLLRIFYECNYVQSIYELNSIYIKMMIFFRPCLYRKSVIKLAINL
jgi:hypothetical protein